MALKVIKTTDNKFGGMAFPYSIDTLPEEVIVNDYKFENFKVIDIGDGHYKIYNYNYVVIVREE